MGGCTLSPPPPLRTARCARVRPFDVSAGTLAGWGELELLRLGRLVRVTDSTRRGARIDYSRAYCSPTPFIVGYPGITRG